MLFHWHNFMFWRSRRFSPSQVQQWIFDRGYSNDLKTNRPCSQDILSTYRYMGFRGLRNLKVCNVEWNRFSYQCICTCQCIYFNKLLFAIDIVFIMHAFSKSMSKYLFQHYFSIAKSKFFIEEQYVNIFMFTCFQSMC